MGTIIADAARRVGYVYSIVASVLHIGGYFVLLSLNYSVPVVGREGYNGFLLNPGKVIKIDIVMFVDSVVAGGSWSWNFYIEGCAP